MVDSSEPFIHEWLKAGENSFGICIGATGTCQVKLTVSASRTINIVHRCDLNPPSKKNELATSYKRWPKVNAHISQYYLKGQ